MVIPFIPKASMNHNIITIIVLCISILTAAGLINENQPIVSPAENSLITLKDKKSGASDSLAWKKVDSLIKMGLTESARKEVEALYQKAKKERKEVQLVKSLLYQIRLESSKEEESTVKALQRLEQHATEAKGPLAAILHSMTAKVYWRYYQDNRWKFHDRTSTVEFKQDDIATWDLSKIVSAAVSHYDRSLAESESLKNIPTENIGDILIDTGRCDKRVPTLYDFINRQAADFFMNTEADLPEPAQVFRLDKSEYFGRCEDFTKLNCATKDTLSLTLRALKILQNLIAFHLHDDDPEALVDIDLIRLKFIHRHSTIEHSDSLYRAALKQVEKRCGSNPAAAEVAYEIAATYAHKESWYEPGISDKYRWFNKQAVDICDDAIKKFPKSYGACLCAALKNNIEAKSLSLKVEEVNVPNTPLCALISWKNIKKVWLRAVPFDEIEYEKSDRYEDTVLERIRKEKPAVEWNVALPDSGDYQHHSAEILIPKLKPGFYLLMASTDAKFSYPGNIIGITPLRVSQIAYFGRAIEEGYELYVRDRQGGGPLAKATVKTRYQENVESSRGYRWIDYGFYKTDAEGRVAIPNPVIPNQARSNSFNLEIKCKNDRLVREQYYNQHYRPGRSSPLQTRFFTDRSIYRPGQTIYFKGLVFRRDNDKSTIVPRQTTTVTFEDFRHQKISSLTLTTNEYGTFSGHFIARAGGLNGLMIIRNEWGQTEVSVEEYKRPKFEVTIHKAKGAYRLNGPVTITGHAKAYAGSFINGATVKFRVTRSARFPFWFAWSGLHCPSSHEQFVANDSTMTDDTGGFKITFPAVADSTVAKSDNPIFIYTVSADVTDGNGETRSASTNVSVKYTALNLSLDLPQHIDKTKDTAYHITAVNMSGVPEQVRGVIRIFRLKGPAIPVRARLWDKPDSYTMTKKEYASQLPGFPYADEGIVVKWPREKKILEKAFNTKEHTSIVFAGIKNWQQGIYVAETSARDAFDETVTTTQYFTLYDTGERHAAAPLCDLFIPIKTSGEPGEKALFLIGSGEKEVKILFEIEHKYAIVKKEWLSLSKSQKLVEVPIEEKHRGHFHVHFTFIKNGRSYQHNQNIIVPWTNKKCNITFVTFRNKLLPGEKEQWEIKIAGPDKEKVAAEMVVAMYDASLDSIKRHRWHFNSNSYYYSMLAWNMSERFGCEHSLLFDYKWHKNVICPYMRYPDFDLFGPGSAGRRGVAGIGYGAGYGSGFGGSGSGGIDDLIGGLMGGDGGGGLTLDKNGISETIAAELAAIKARTNLSETAFFFPHLTTNEQGEIIVSFTVPEALTRWKMLGFAHTKDLKYGGISRELITSKPLMVMANLPRFLREHDTITLAAKVTNCSDSALSGSARLILFDATTMKPIDTLMGNLNTIKNVTIKKGLSQNVTWDIHVPEGIPAVSVRVVAKADNFSDGEEKALPVLTNRMLVTETMPLPMRGKGEKNFIFDKLVSQNRKSTTLRNHRLTLEFTQNPAWYAVQALPYLMDFPYECAEQTFARYYANTVATAIANSTPKIKAVFDAWKSTGGNALLSNLEKNQELKSALIEETPWVIEGANESERKRRFGLLFDLNRMSDELGIAKRKLAGMQLSNGGWSWFKGMPEDRYITQYIVTGFGRLRHLKTVDLSKDGELNRMVERAVRYTDDRIREDYDLVMHHASHPDSNHLGSLQIQYLYMRSFFNEIAVHERNKKAYDYYTNQAVKYWLQNNRYQQGMIALALDRMGVKDLPRHIIRSLKENSLSSEEMGMYWKERYEEYYWYEAPIETQALLIEAFDEVAADTASVEAMKVWLIKSKQTQNWKTTKATTEACHALLLRGADLLATNNTVTVSLGSQTIDPKKFADLVPEAGTGYFKTSWSGGEIKPDMGNITVTKSGPGVAWGGLYWQYFEQLDKVTGATSPLTLSKKLFIKRYDNNGTVLHPVSDKSTISVGDKITVRIVLRADRDLEYVHMKDMRAAGFEPVNVLSSYKWQDGLGYYESTRDCATHFFFSTLNKGVYVFEYDLLASQTGDFSNGIASIQCMYAPELASHSEGIRVKAGK
jgi:hypothetical protein